MGPLPVAPLQWEEISAVEYLLFSAMLALEPRHIYLAYQNVKHIIHR